MCRYIYKCYRLYTNGAHIETYKKTKYYYFVFYETESNLSLTISGYLNIVFEILYATLMGACILDLLYFHRKQI